MSGLGGISKITVVCIKAITPDTFSRQYQQVFMLNMLSGEESRANTFDASNGSSAILRIDDLHLAAVLTEGLMVMMEISGTKYYSHVPFFQVLFKPQDPFYPFQGDANSHVPWAKL